MRIEIDRQAMRHAALELAKNIENYIQVNTTVHKKTLYELNLPAGRACVKRLIMRDVVEQADDFFDVVDGGEVGEALEQVIDAFTTLCVALGVSASIDLAITIMVEPFRNGKTQAAMWRRKAARAVRNGHPALAKGHAALADAAEKNAAKWERWKAEYKAKKAGKPAPAGDPGDV